MTKIIVSNITDHSQIVTHIFKLGLGYSFSCCWLLRGIEVHGSLANSFGVSPSPRIVQAVSGRGYGEEDSARAGASPSVTIVIHYSRTHPVVVQIYFRLI